MKDESLGFGVTVENGNDGLSPGAGETKHFRGIFGPNQLKSPVLQNRVFLAKSQRPPVVGVEGAVKVDVIAARTLS